MLNTTTDVDLTANKSYLVRPTARRVTTPAMNANVRLVFPFMYVYLRMQLKIMDNSFSVRRLIRITVLPVYNRPTHQVQSS